MVVNIQKIINKIALVMKVKLEDTKKNNVLNSCVTTTVFKILKDSKQTLGPINQLESLEIKQWIEYFIVYAAYVDNPQNSKIILKELNEILATKTYLVGYRLTIADILLFFILRKVLESLPNLEKEKCLNLCRWFDNVQYDDLLRSNNNVIDFSSNYLAALAPARH